MSRPFFNREMAARRASKTLRDYQRLRGADLVLPVDAELVGEWVYNLSWDWDRIPEPRGQRILAGLYVGEARAVLNERHMYLFDKKPGMEHFTRAHEVGHADLHAPPGALGSGDDCGLIKHRDFSDRNQGDEYWCERQADWYAAALLMPEDLFIPIVRDNLPKTADESEELATTRFRVTYTAFNFRLRELGFPYFDRTGSLCKPMSHVPNQQNLF